MKLFTDMSTEIATEIELNESSSEKTYVIKGIFSSPGVKNRNGRIYPMNIWENNVIRYQDEIKNNSINTLAELEHPPRSTVNPWEAVAKTRLLEMRDGKVYGEMEILNNNSKETNQLKALIEAGISIGVSTRGVGRLGKGQMVEEYQLITTDIVSNPSDYGANLSGFSESLIMEDANFGIEEGKVVCTPSGCKLEEAKKLKDNDGKEMKSFEYHGDSYKVVKVSKNEVIAIGPDGEEESFNLDDIKNQDDNAALIEAFKVGDDAFVIINKKHPVKVRIKEIKDTYYIVDLNGKNISPSKNGIFKNIKDAKASLNEEIQVKETLCSIRAKALIESMMHYSKEEVILSQNDIKAFDIISLHEKKPTYKEIQKKITDLRKEMKKYKKGSDEWDVLDFELTGYEEYLAKTIDKGRGPKNVNEDSGFDKIYENFSKAFGKMRTAVERKDKKAAGYLNKIWQDIDNIIDPVFPIDEAKFNKDSMIHNGRPSSEIITDVGRYGDASRGDLSIWINGGSAYEFNFDNTAASAIRELNYKAREKEASAIAVKVAKLVDKEVQALEKKYKD